MKTVEKGHFVKVRYTGTLEDGEVFDSTQGCQPMEVQIGAGQLIEGFESALLGMSVNEKKTFTLDPDRAYGVRDEALCQSLERSALPPDFTPEPGEVVVLQDQEGCQTLATVKHLDEASLVVDLNHPLAGKALTFEIEVAEINDVASPAPAECGSCCGCH